MEPRAMIEYLRQLGDIKYCVVGREEHIDGFPHLHAVVLFNRRLNKRRNVFNCDVFNANVEVIGSGKRDLEQAIKYVKKENNYEWIGIEPQIERRLEKAEKLNFAIENTIENCVATGRYSISELVKIPTLKAIVKRPRNIVRNVLWFHGETGTGKTREAIRLMEEKYKDNYWVSAGDIKNFKNGYAGEEGVILDDLRCGDIKFNDLLRLCNRYKYSVNVKGTVIPWMAVDIIITSPHHPIETFVKFNKVSNNWEAREDIEQLLRRIQIFEFPRSDDSTLLVL